MKEGLLGPHPGAKFSHCHFKNVGLQPPKSPKLVIFGVNLPKRGILPYAMFIKFGLERVPGPHRHAKFHRFGYKNVDLQPQKSRKIAVLV